jgi:Cys-tRNA synthase (O-phospho-L-seryl-tRNA:Cys-tRNA synthase)
VLQPAPRLVSLSHVPTNSGRVYDAAGVGAACAAAGVPYLLDACQSVGQMPLDVQQLQCDFLTGKVVTLAYDTPIEAVTYIPSIGSTHVATNTLRQHTLAERPWHVATAAV